MRIEKKSWDEKIGESTVTRTLTVCPDPECQKIVERELLDKKTKLGVIHRESLERRKLMRRGAPKAE